MSLWRVTLEYLQESRRSCYVIAPSLIEAVCIAVQDQFQQQGEVLAAPVPIAVELLDRRDPARSTRDAEKAL